MIIKMLETIGSSDDYKPGITKFYGRITHGENFEIPTTIAEKYILGFHQPTDVIITLANPDDTFSILSDNNSLRNVEEAVLGDNYVQIIELLRSKQVLIDEIEKYLHSIFDFTDRQDLASQLIEKVRAVHPGEGMAMSLQLALETNHLYPYDEEFVNVFLRNLLDDVNTKYRNKYQDELETFSCKDYYDGLETTIKVYKKMLKHASESENIDRKFYDYLMKINDVFKEMIEK